MQVGQQVGHGLWIGLKARHRRGFAADDLLDQGRIVFPLADAMQVGANNALGRNAMTAGAVDQEQLAAMVLITMQRKTAAHIGITLARARDQGDQHDAGGEGKGHQGSNQPVSAG